MPIKIALTLVAVSIIWATSFPLIKIALESLSAGHLTLLRHVLASISFLLVMLIKKHKLLPQKKDFAIFGVLGLLGYTIYQTALNFGEINVSAGTASLIISSAPAFTTVIAYFMLKDRLRPLAWLGVLISLIGVILIVLGENSSFSINLYALLILVAALSASFYTVVQKPLFKKYSAIQVTAYSVWAGTIPMFIFSSGLINELQATSFSSMAAVIYLGIAPSAIAYTLFAYAVANAEVSRVTSFMYLVPVFALLFSWFMLAEVPSFISLVGGIIAISGIVLVNKFKN